MVAKTVAGRVACIFCLLDLLSGNHQPCGCSDIQAFCLDEYVEISRGYRCSVARVEVSCPCSPCATIILPHADGFTDQFGSELIKCRILVMSTQFELYA